MITKPTVLILGAGASMPYRFPSGERLFQSARGLNLNELADTIRPAARSLAPPLQLAVRNSLDKSLDAMLELRPDLSEAGKAYMARVLLQAEAAARERVQDDAGAWYRILWSAFDLSSLDGFRKTPLTIITYNYDRSVEYALISSLQQRFNASWDECAAALDCVGPIHLHGQLGFLPGTTPRRDDIVVYGSAPDGITDADCIAAARNIKIVHEPKPNDEAFVRARDAIAAANRVAFLGFGYAKQNIERLQLTGRMNPTTFVYLCVYGFTPQEELRLIKPHFQFWTNISPGIESEDIVQYLRRYVDLLL